MTDMSVAAKERAFAKDRVFTAQQEQWLDACMQLSAAVPHERLVIESFRKILIHLKLPRDRMLAWGTVLATQPQPLVHTEVVTAFRELIVTANVFAGDTELRALVRDAAMLCAVRPGELK
jgi:hypothetical protein